MADVLLFKRRIRVVVDTIEAKDLAMTFRIHKSLKPEPNTAELTIYNLNPDHRSALEQLKTASVLIEAGYEQGVSTLFLGDLRTAISTNEGPDIVTKLSSGDGEKATKKSRVKVSLKKGAATPQKVLEAVAKALGVGEGNLKTALSQLGAVANHFSEGTVITGSAAKEMTAICQSLGLTWSIQDGKLQILSLRKALDGEAIKLSKDTGMIGSPTVDNDGVLSVNMLLAPDVFPGRKLVLEAQRLKGQYRIETCDYAGDTHGQDWYIKITAKRY
jgi:hypothetical protein